MVLLEYYTPASAKCFLPSFCDLLLELVFPRAYVPIYRYHSAVLIQFSACLITKNEGHRSIPRLALHTEVRLCTDADTCISTAASGPLLHGHRRVEDQADAALWAFLVVLKISKFFPNSIFRLLAEVSLSCGCCRPFRDLLSLTQVTSFFTFGL